MSNWFFLSFKKFDWQPAVTIWWELSIWPFKPSLTFWRHVGYLVFLYLLKFQPATQLIDIVNHDNAFTERNRKGEGERERERENLFFFFVNHGLISVWIDFWNKNPRKQMASHLFWILSKGWELERFHFSCVFLFIYFSFYTLCFH